MRGSKCIPLWVDRALFQALEHAAHAEVRSPEQQAVWILRRELERAAPTDERRNLVTAGGHDAA